MHSTSDHPGVRCRGIGKRFGDFWALRDLDLDVDPGRILGLLGHNGAGKTTAVRILTTLSTPTTGTALVGGHDVVTEAHLVRSMIGVAAQQATVDGLLSARKNLVMVGRLHGLGRRAAEARAAELLEALSLADSADNLVKTYSGGMRRRLDLGASIVVEPRVLFLDEPTTGLDPRSRAELWAMLRSIAANGTAIVLTTQYLEEADHLADDIVVLDHGRTVARGHPEELKTRIGTDRLVVEVDDAATLPAAAALLERFATAPPAIDDELSRVTFPMLTEVRLVDIVRALDDAHIEVRDVARREATLDDVFLTLTDGDASSAVAPEPEASLA
jgi:daunorubicin resistance ABC transporter ATP-binding subunit